MDEDTVLRSVMELAQGPTVTKCRVRTQGPKCCFRHCALYSLCGGMNRRLTRGTPCPSLLLHVQSPPQTHCWVQVRNCVSNLIPQTARGRALCSVSACGLTSPGEPKGPYDFY